MTAFQPAIKWSGSKRSQSSAIVEKFPDYIDTYYEPFVGGGSVLMALLLSDKSAKRYVCADNNKNLIPLWWEIMNNPTKLWESYDVMWNELNIDDNIDRKRNYYNHVRERLNTDPSPNDFLFIMRTTVNGMPRYNKDGKFNNAFHLTRNGIQPKRLKKILIFWNNILHSNNVEFHYRDFSTILSSEKDILYLDPPYANTKGMYGDKIDQNKLWDWMGKQKGKYLLSYDGKILGKDDMTFPVPEHLFSEHVYLESGNSSFRRTIGKSNDSVVFESLYIK